MISTRAAVIAAGMLALTSVGLWAQPVRSGWIMSPVVGRLVGDGLARSLPEVHSVDTAGGVVTVRSAGISMHNLAPFQAPPTPVERLRRFEFRVPSEPRPAAEEPVSVRPDILGVFLNGQPIYNYFDAASYQGQDIWRHDLIARNDDGTLTAAGAPRDELEHKIQLGLLKGLIERSGNHSPVLGYAFDGSPVYGPWGFANADGSGGTSRLRSSYQVRSIDERTHWPDGTELTLGQSGPPVSPDYPLGSFVEDYEFTRGSGDLDRFNGRFAVTPEYIGGVYAYFLSTDEQGRLAFPYFIAGEYRGRVSLNELDRAVLDWEVGEVDPEISLLDRDAREQGPGLQFQIGPENTIAGQPALLSFQALDAEGIVIRSLEYVHERPIHLLVVSEDLSRFDHIHPELRAGGRYLVRHVFPRAGKYRIYADYTPPGGAQRVESFEIQVAGDSDPVEPLTEDGVRSRSVGPIRVGFARSGPLTAAQDIELVFRVRDAETGKRIPEMKPFLGAWGHFVLIREGHGSFIHAHPIEGGQGGLPSAISHSHVHGVGTEALGPPPSEIRVLTNFEQPGLYKLWAQFGVRDDVVTVSFILRIEKAAVRTPERVPIPEGSTLVQISSTGFVPSRVTIDPRRPATLAFARSGEPNCGSTVVFPALGLTTAVPLGGIAVVELPAGAGDELTFSCGMGMYRGTVVIRESPAEERSVAR